MVLFWLSLNCTRLLFRYEFEPVIVFLSPCVPPDCSRHVNRAVSLIDRYIRSPHDTAQVTMSNRMPSVTRSAHPSITKVAIALIVVVGVSAFFYFDLARFLSLTALQENRDRLLAFTEANYG